MSKYVPDILSRRWVIISAQRVDRPNNDFHIKHIEGCHFCPGNEQFTPDVVLKYDKSDKSGWQVKAFPNKYPITDFHEVIVHSPDHNADLDTVPSADVELIIRAYKERFNFYKEKGQVLIFCNHGEQAGASIQHPHSQLVVIPFQINLDTLPREPLNNVVEENDLFHLYCPDFSQWPYEIWVTPKTEETLFGDITDKEIQMLAKNLQSIITRLKSIHKGSRWASEDFGYNYYIYPNKGWYIRIIPRFVYRAGFELGTGLQVNIVDPRDAAAEYKKQDKQQEVMNKLLAKVDQ